MSDPDENGKVRCSKLNCVCQQFVQSLSNCRLCANCQHGWVEHAMTDMAPGDGPVQTTAESVAGVASMILKGTEAIPVQLKPLLDKLLNALDPVQKEAILTAYEWSSKEYQNSYKDTANLMEPVMLKSCDDIEISSILPQFQRFVETRNHTVSTKVDTEPIDVNEDDKMVMTDYHDSASASTTAPSTSTIPSSMPLDIPMDYRSMFVLNNLATQCQTLTSQKLATGLGNQMALMQMLYRQQIATTSKAAEPGSLMAFANRQKTELSDLMGIFPKQEPRNWCLTGGPSDCSQGKMNVPPTAIGGSFSEGIQSPNLNAGLAQLRGDTFPSRWTSRSNSPAVSLPGSTSQRRSAPHPMSDKDTNPKNGKKRVRCEKCGKNYCDKGALKIHDSAVHLREKHRCSVKGCSKEFSSRRSRNRHSANTNPLLHVPTDKHKGPLYKQYPNDSDNSFDHLFEEPMASDNDLDIDLGDNEDDEDVDDDDDIGVEVFRVKSSEPGDMSQAMKDLHDGSFFSTNTVPNYCNSVLARSSPVCSENSGSGKRKAHKPTKHVPVTDERLGDVEIGDQPLNLSIAKPCDVKKDEATAEINTYGKKIKLETKYHTDAIGQLQSMTTQLDSGVSSDQWSVDKVEPNEGSTENEDKFERSPSRQSMISEIEEDSMKTEQNEDETESYCSTPSVSRWDSSKYEGMQIKFQTSKIQDGDLSIKIPIDEMNPNVCVECKKSFRTHFSVKTHFQNVHMKIPFTCKVKGCEAAFPSKRSRDRHSENINMHKKLLSTTTNCPQVGLNLTDKSLFRFPGDALALASPLPFPRGLPQTSLMRPEDVFALNGMSNWPFLNNLAGVNCLNAYHPLMLAAMRNRVIQGANLFPAKNDQS